ncbi:MAG: hypothetical protein KF802_14780 [Bdellovibrionaceae bacterium]|nr:hypothetical protein [Pseudobdellovibrionaceae bacterium]
MDNRWTPEFEARVFRLFERLFRDRDPLILDELRELLTEAELGVGTLAGFVQMELDGHAVPGTREAYDHLKRAHPEAADVVIRAVRKGGSRESA